MARTFLMVALLLASCQQVTWAQSFTGNYTGKDKGGKVTLTLKQLKGGQVSGNMSTKGLSAQITGKATGNRISGKITMVGVSAQFKGILVGNYLELSANGRTQQLTRVSDEPHARGKRPRSGK